MRTVKKSMPTYVSYGNTAFDNINPYGMGVGAVLCEVTPQINADMIDGDAENYYDGNIDVWAYAKGLRINYSMRENDTFNTATGFDKYYRVMVVTPKLGIPDAQLEIGDMTNSWHSAGGNQPTAPWHSVFTPKASQFRVVKDTGWKSVRAVANGFVNVSGTGTQSWIYKPQHGHFYLNFKNKKVWRPTQNSIGNLFMNMPRYYVYIVTNYPSTIQCPDFRVNTHFYYKSTTT